MHPIAGCEFRRCMRQTLSDLNVHWGAGFWRKGLRGSRVILSAAVARSAQVESKSTSEVKKEVLDLR